MEIVYILSCRIEDVFSISGTHTDTQQQLSWTDLPHHHPQKQHTLNCIMTMRRKWNLIHF
jgi:hypothetical protein